MSAASVASTTQHNAKGRQMQTANVVRLGYNADTELYTEYAPIPDGADGVAIGAEVQAVFIGVRCAYNADSGTLYCIHHNQETANGASWFACGLASGCATPARFRV
jgi:hypothetical protein